MNINQMIEALTSGTHRRSELDELRTAFAAAQGDWITTQSQVNSAWTG